MFRAQKEELKKIFKRARLEKLPEFRKGLSEYLLTKFYIKKKQEHKGEQLSAELQAKFKAVFDVISNLQSAKPDA